MLKAKYERSECYTTPYDTIFLFNQVKKLKLMVIDVGYQEPPAIIVSGIKRVKKKILKSCRKELVQDQGLEHLVFKTIRGNWNIEICISYMPFTDKDDIRYWYWNIVSKAEFDFLKILLK
jgi:hypothetical protein